MPPIADLDTLLRTLAPQLQPGTYVYVPSPAQPDFSDTRVVAAMREAEGLCLIVEASYAQAHGLQAVFECAWITLNVNSDLAAVGLTAAFATALGQAGISCNVVAGLHHDHLFVPAHQAAQAMVALHGLQQGQRANP
jgi:uncharacterized protein